MDSPPATLDVWQPDFLNIDQTMVTLQTGEKKVGTEAKYEFSFYRAILSAASPYFLAAFEGEFEEAGSKSLKIKTVSARTMGIFQHWLYTGNLILPADSTARFIPTEYDLATAETFVNYGNGCPVKCTGCGGLDLSKLGEEYQMVHWYDDLLDIIIFAEEYELSHLSRDAIILWQYQDELWGSLPPFEVIIDAFNNLRDDSSLPRYITAVYNHLLGSNLANVKCECYFEATQDEPDPPTAENLPVAFTNQLGRIPLEHTGASLDWCDFHHHSAHSPDDGFDEVGACQKRRFAVSAFGQNEQFVRKLQAQADAEQEDENSGAYDNTTQGQYY